MKCRALMDVNQKRRRKRSLIMLHQLRPVRADETCVSTDLENDAAIRYQHAFCRSLCSNTFLRRVQNKEGVINRNGKKRKLNSLITTHSESCSLDDFSHFDILKRLIRVED